MTEQTIVDIVAALIPIISTLISGAFGTQWAFSKNKISKIRDALSEIETALEDDNVSDTEFRRIYYKLSAIGKS